MDKDDIITLPHTHLRQRSKKVGIVTEEIQKIIQGMQDATVSWEQSRNHEVGVALAAVQIDKLLRIVVVRNDFENKEDHTFTVFINPVITKYEGEIKEDYEGCLSVKDVYGKVPRYTKVRIKWQDINGKIHTRKIDEPFLARIFQHEIDHTNGIVFIDHIKDNPDAFFTLEADGSLEKLEYDTQVKNSADLWS